MLVLVNLKAVLRSLCDTSTAFPPQSSCSTVYVKFLTVLLVFFATCYLYGRPVFYLTDYLLTDRAAHYPSNYLLLDYLRGCLARYLVSVRQLGILELAVTINTNLW